MKADYRMIRLTAVLLLGLMASSSVLAQALRTYEVTVTNITMGQSFTPVLATTHHRSVSLFTLGQPASEELGILAESGNPQPLMDLLNSHPEGVHDVTATEGLLHPGESVTLEIMGERGRGVISLAAMLIPTNDAFMALNSFRLPFADRTTTLVAYDAGTELNDESCASIPGPVCGGEALSAEDGEGYVYVSNGISGSHDLPAYVYDWRNPVASVSIRRLD